MILIILGDGVVAGVLLRNSKAENSGWIVITFGWAMAVAVAVYCVGQFSGAHINPAVTIAFAATGQFDWALVPGYIIAQFLGAFVGAVIVWLAYLPHWAETEDAGPQARRVLHRAGHLQHPGERHHRDHRHLRAGLRRLSASSRTLGRSAAMPRRS